MSTEKANDDVWAIVELMGHLRLAGKLTEEERFGAKMGRLDIPDGDGFVTRYFGGASVYSITIVSEAVARHVRKSTQPEPVSPWDFPKQLPAPAAVHPQNQSDQDDDGYRGDFTNDAGYEADPRD